MSSEYHSMEKKELLESLKVTEKGLTTEEAERRLKEFGPNELVEKKKISPLQIFLGQFKDIFVIMLLFAMAVSLIIAFTHDGSEYVDAATIGAIIFLNALVGFVQEYRSEKAMEAMKQLTAPKARVLRDGQEQLIPAREVVPGDIVLLEAGDRIPADSRVLEVVDLKTDEAILTGESTAVDKKDVVLGPKTAVADRKNSLFMATHLTYGRGKAVITSTGMKTEFGKVAEMVQSVEQTESPLKQKLTKFAKKLGILIILVSAAIFTIELYEIFFLSAGGSFESVLGDLIVAFETAIALAVSAVPEGLPAVVTVSLALGARELAKRKALIRRLSSAETLGATDIICSDKTGTLTKGEMTVRKIYVNDKMVSVSGAGYEPKGDFLVNGNKIDATKETDLELLLRSSTLCANANYDGTKVLGDTTEGAIIVAAAKAGMIKTELDSQYPRLQEIPFTSERKRMTTVHKTPDGKVVSYVKGAVEILLDRSVNVIKGGKVVKLTQTEKDQILKTNEEMANQALRVLAIAYKELPPNANTDYDEEDLESNLVFIGLAGMIDPPRDEAKGANELCRKAGIKTVMITGDHKLTAVAIAKELTIMVEGDLAFTGAELDKMTDTEFENIVEKAVVYARVSPEHKLRIVKALKDKGHIVAMTGDGVNDAPALKQADIGIAMGITGTDVTREAADMVLADDNFATIVTAVEGGRAIYDNIRKFSFFLLRSNFDELLVIAVFAFLGPILGTEESILPLTAQMILWINLVTDGGPALALSMDPPQEDLMSRKPRNPNDGILHGRGASIMASFLSQALATGGLFAVAYFVWGHSLAYAQTMAFMQATLRELLVVWNCRSETKSAFRLSFTSNKFLLFAVIASMIVSAAVPYTGLLGTVPLSLMDWAVIIPISMSGFLIMPEIFYGRKIWRWG
ncbi:MAG: cation-translocating P-type ATPase [Candidatus Bathyarchaeota archaeon]|nr:cation-translocating P-type ATPase [Candidatus Bathyarchaeum tardum]WGM90212.1 MAG: cation-translocating P-type ATPase [Candidatus Bathyarchaeum tardum]